MRRTGYTAACLVSGEYASLGLYKTKREAVTAGENFLPIFEVIRFDKGGRKVVEPLMYGWALPEVYNRM